MLTLVLVPVISCFSLPTRFPISGLYGWFNVSCGWFVWLVEHFLCVVCLAGLALPVCCLSGWFSVSYALFVWLV